VARRVPLRSRLRDSSGSGGGGGGGGGGGSSSSSDGRQQQQQRRAAAAATTTASLNFSSGGLGLGFSRGAASVYCSTETTIRDVSNRFPLFEPFTHKNEHFARQARDKHRENSKKGGYKTVFSLDERRGLCPAQDTKNDIGGISFVQFELSVLSLSG
jgi:hypothetical protein